VPRLLGAERFDYVGWSFGALIASPRPGWRPTGSRLAMIDHIGTVDVAAYAASAPG